MSNPEFRPWPLTWTPQHVVRYWNWWSSNAALQHLYFSKRFGPSILDEVAKVVPLRGNLLDFGCGPGHLLEHALSRGLRVTGADSSSASLAALNQRLGGRPGFLGAHVLSGGGVPIADGTADIVTVIETVEHVDDSELGPLLTEVRRLVRPGGHVVVTTPHDEPLAELEVMCPNCGCVFHQFQHVRSFTSQALAEKMESQGFTTISCRPLLFSFLPRWMRPVYRLVYPHVKGKLPHLMYVGTRR